MSSATLSAAATWRVDAASVTSRGAVRDVALTRRHPSHVERRFDGPLRYVSPLPPRLPHLLSPPSLALSRLHGVQRGGRAGSARAARAVGAADGAGFKGGRLEDGARLVMGDGRWSRCRPSVRARIGARCSCRAGWMGCALGGHPCASRCSMPRASLSLPRAPTPGPVERAAMLTWSLARARWLPVLGPQKMRAKWRKKRMRRLKRKRRKMRARSK